MHCVFYTVICHLWINHGIINVRDQLHNNNNVEKIRELNIATTIYVDDSSSSSTVNKTENHFSH
jgi:hypothetical protein